MDLLDSVANVYVILFGFLYPAYRMIVLRNTRQTKQTHAKLDEWTSYWPVFATTYCVIVVAQWLLSSILPLFWLIKVCGVTLLVLSAPDKSSYLFERLAKAIKTYQPRLRRIERHAIESVCVCSLTCADACDAVGIPVVPALLTAIATRLGNKDGGDESG